MSNASRAEHSPRILFLGMQGTFSPPPLRALLEAGIEVCAVVVPAQQRGPDQPALRRLEQPQKTRPLLPMLDSALHTSIVQMAWERQIPAWEVQRLSDSETVSIFAAYQADAICVACFSLYIPRVILAIPRLGCLNVHPSLLPAKRGPEPLFWTFQEGTRHTGVTIHLLDEGMDSGPIVAQEVVAVPDGVSYAWLEARCAELGGKLLARSLWGLYRGLAVPVPQDETGSSYHPYPSEEDFVVPVGEWSARHVYNFICGVASWGVPIRLRVDDHMLVVREAISYSHKDIGQATRMVEEGEEIEVRCREGSVRVIVARL